MTALSDKLAALAKDATPGSLISQGWGDGSTPDGVTNIFNEDAEVLLMECIPVGDATLIVELVNNLPTIIEALREQEASNG